MIRGVTFANFQAEGNFCSAKALFKIIEAGWARTFAISFNNQIGKPSGPEALRALSFFKARWVSGSDRVGLVGGGGGRGVITLPQRDD